MQIRYMIRKPPTSRDRGYSERGWRQWRTKRRYEREDGTEEERIALNQLERLIRAIFFVDYERGLFTDRFGQFEDFFLVKSFGCYSIEDAISFPVDRMLSGHDCIDVIDFNQIHFMGRGSSERRLMIGMTLLHKNLFAGSLIDIININIFRVADSALPILIKYSTIKYVTFGLIRRQQYVK